MVMPTPLPPLPRLLRGSVVIATAAAPTASSCTRHPR